MDIETIAKLIDAGYTKEEIDKLTAGAGDPQSENAGAPPETAGEEQGTAGQENAGKIETGVSIEAAIEALTNTVAGLKDTVKAMQDANAGQAATDTAKKDVIEETIKGFVDTL
jgi:hypothetical protein